MQLHHVFVPVRFGEDGSRRNRHVFTVALNNTMMRNLLVRIKTIAVYQQALWFYSELVKSPVHCRKGSIQNIDLVDFMWVYSCYGPGQCCFLNYLPEFIANICIQLFAVIQQGNGLRLIKNDCRRKYRSGKTSSSCLITTRLNKVVAMVRKETQSASFSHRYECKEYVLFANEIH